jgi:hypothetical protein
MSLITVEVVGAKAFKGVIDGKMIDSSSLFSRVKLSAQHNKDGSNFKGGETVEEWKCPNAQCVFDLQNVTFPFMAKLEIERVSNGKETKEIVVGLEFLTAVKPESAAPVVRPVSSSTAMARAA